LQLVAPKSRRIFIQYLNPEILSLYHFDHRESTGFLYQQIMKLTVYSLLFSTDSLIMPASYLFEVGLIERFLKDVDRLLKTGILQFTSSTPDLDAYTAKKKQEYRDDLVLFPGYKDEVEPRAEPRKHLTWIPRINRSSSADIATAWKAELYKPEGIWRKIIEKRFPQLRLLPSKIETAIESVPDRLEDRAFIHRYADALLPIELEDRERTQEGMLISRAYLESYLDELDAMIVTDTPIGDLRCGLNPILNGHLRTLSFRKLNSFFHGMNLSNDIEHLLGWNGLIQLRDEFVFKWLMNLLIQDSLDESRPFEQAVIMSKFDHRDTSLSVMGRRPIDRVLDQLKRLFQAVEPFLKQAVTGSDNILQSTMPMTEHSGATRRRRRRGSAVKTKQVVTIVLASPSDLKPERKTLSEVVEELNRGIAAELGLTLELVRWETDAYPGFHAQGPQGLIDSVLKIEECDLLIGVFWKRFGTPVFDGKSGTEHEILTAHSAWQESGKPQIMIYFNEKPHTPQSRGETDQWGRVLEFKERFPKEGLWWAYKGKSEFERLVRQHLTSWVRSLNP
jgi:hypothetical protein